MSILLGLLALCLMALGGWAVFILYVTQHARVSKEGLFLLGAGIVLMVGAYLL